MSASEEMFEEVGGAIRGAERSQMFGKPCFKRAGKAFACFFEDEMVFKLPEDLRAEALSLKGAQRFDPSGKGRAMKAWIQVPFAHAETWTRFARAASADVA